MLGDIFGPIVGRFSTPGDMAASLTPLATGVLLDAQLDILTLDATESGIALGLLGLGLKKCGEWFRAQKSRASGGDAGRGSSGTGDVRERARRAAARLQQMERGDNIVHRLKGDLELHELGLLDDETLSGVVDEAVRELRERANPRARS